MEEIRMKLIQMFVTFCLITTAAWSSESNCHLENPLVCSFVGGESKRMVHSFPENNQGIYTYTRSQINQISDNTEPGGIGVAHKLPEAADIVFDLFIERGCLCRKDREQFPIDKARSNCGSIGEFYGDACFVYTAIGLFTIAYEEIAYGDSGVTVVASDNPEYLIPEDGN